MLKGKQWLGGMTAALFLILAAADARPQTPPAAAGNPVKTPGNAQWASTVDEARQRAAAESKFLFVEFGKEGCGNCRRMDVLLYPALDFEALLLPMIPVKVSLDSAEGKELASRENVTDIPAILIKSPEGRRVFLMQGFADAPEFYKHVHEELDAYKTFAKKLEAQDIPRLSAREAFETGMELFARGDSAAALPRLKRATAAPGKNVEQRESAYELLAAVQLDGGDIAGSRQTINRLLDATKDPRRRERAELFLAQIPLAENKPEEAYALFMKFEKDHPKSPYLGQLRAMIARMAGETLKP